MPDSKEYDSTAYSKYDKRKNVSPFRVRGIAHQKKDKFYWDLSNIGETDREKKLRKKLDSGRLTPNSYNETHNEYFELRGSRLSNEQNDPNFLTNVRKKLEQHQDPATYNNSECSNQESQSYVDQQPMQGQTFYPNSLPQETYQGYMPDDNSYQPDYNPYQHSYQPDYNPYQPDDKDKSRS